MDSRWKVSSLGKSECFMQPIQMQFSQKPKIFSQFFSPLPTSTSNFEHFGIKTSLIVDLLPKL